MEWGAVRSGVKRKVFEAEGGTLVLNHLEPGHTPQPHSHANAQIVHILQGEAEFTVISSPATLSRIPTTADSRTLGKVFGIFSIASGEMFSPFRRMVFFNRPSK